MHHGLSSILNYLTLVPRRFRQFHKNKRSLVDRNVCVQVVELLQFIFGESSNRQKIIEELLVHDLFRNIDLREMRSAPVTVQIYF